MKIVFTLIIALAILGSCASTNRGLSQKKISVEYYRIFDIKTDAKRQDVIKAASAGLAQNVNSAREASPIPSFSEAPETAGRFKLVNPFEGTNMAALAAMGGTSSIKIATCEGAVWSADATRSVKGSSDLRLTACLFEYKDGFHIDFYATFEKKEGGVEQIGRNLTSAIAGSPEAWTEKVFNDIVKSIHQSTGAEIVYLEGYPEPVGTPWFDQ